MAIAKMPKNVQIYALFDKKLIWLDAKVSEMNKRQDANNGVNNTKEVIAIGNINHH